MKLADLFYSKSNVENRLRKKISRWRRYGDRRVTSLLRSLSRDERNLYISRRKAYRRSFYIFEEIFHNYQREIDRLNESLGVYDDLEFSSLRRSMDKIELSCFDPALVYADSDLKDYFAKIDFLGPFKQPVDLRKISSNFGLLISYMSYEGEFSDSGRWSRYVEYARLRRAILLKHSSVTMSLTRLGLYKYRRPIYRFFEFLFYYYTENFWFFFDRYRFLRIILFDLNIIIVSLIFVYYFFGYILFFLYYRSYFYDIPYLWFLIWRRDWILSSPLGPYISLILLGYPVYALPFLVILFTCFKPNPSLLFTYSEVYYRVFIFFNFFFAFITCSLEVFLYPAPWEYAVYVCRYDRCYYVLDYLFVFTSYLPHFFCDNFIFF